MKFKVRRAWDSDNCFVREFKNVKDLVAFRNEMGCDITIEGKNNDKEYIDKVRQLHREGKSFCPTSNFPQTWTDEQKLAAAQAQDRQQVALREPFYDCEYILRIGSGD